MNEFLLPVNVFGRAKQRPRNGYNDKLCDSSQNVISVLSGYKLQTQDFFLQA